MSASQSGFDDVMIRCFDSRLLGERGWRSESSLVRSRELLHASIRQDDDSEAIGAESTTRRPRRISAAVERMGVTQIRIRSRPASAPDHSRRHLRRFAACGAIPVVHLDLVCSLPESPSLRVASVGSSERVFFCSLRFSGV